MLETSQKTAPRYVTDYWGKAMPAQQEGPRWHPLAYHNLDVAAAGEALLNARPHVLRPLVQATGLPEDVVRHWLLYALALHDIGKFADCFQIKSEGRWRHRDSDHWRKVTLGADLGHGRFGLTLWNKWSDPDDDAMTPLFGAGNFSATHAFACWMRAVAGHHGRPVEIVNGNLSERICDEALADARAYALDCTTLFDLAVPADVPKLKENPFKRTSWLVAGIAMVSDWIGSNDRDWFKYEEPALGLADYWERARDIARKALSEAGLSAPRLADRYTLNDILAKKDKHETDPTPTPLQIWAAEQAPISGQSLIVIEDLTGAGKTEAALLIAHRLMRAGAAEGLYWALPTMATADALYTRLAASYGAMFADARDASLVLAHGSREFNEIFQKSIKLGEPGKDNERSYGSAPEDADITASAACARWIADDRRKTFLADVGVGTIDQALLSVLPSKHQAMRLAGLCRRVLVVDEIHSFDPYVHKLTEGLLRFHAAFGGSAILMSATLTRKARETFAKAFAEGAGWKPPKIEKTGFPLATVVNRDGVCECEIPTTETVSRGTRRDLPVKRLDNEDAAIAILAEAQAQGLGAVWIRNTVQDTMDAYAAVKERLPDANVDLFHARFALGDRLEIEKRVLASFGKDSAGDQRRRIVIATQVMEQSLDCDWDVMISDLAPVDLLIQRAGRLHRHDHRGLRFDPVLHVVGPEPSHDAAASWYKAAFPRAQYVYKHHGQLWLTLRVLLDADGLKLKTASPRDVIERVYADEETLPASALKTPDALQAMSSKAVADEISQRVIAGMNLLKFKEGYIPQAGAWETDTRTPTRLGDPQRVLRLAKWNGSRLISWAPVDENEARNDAKQALRRAWRLSEVSVLAIRVADSVPGNAVLKQAVAREIASWPDSYDPPLLVALVQKDGIWVAEGISKRDDKVSPIKLIYCEKQGLRFETL